MIKNDKPANKVLFLPAEIQENILCRLPVKTILKFMSVCKSWYSLFQDPRFISMHQKNSSSNTLLLARLQVNKELIVTDTSSVIHSRVRIVAHTRRYRRYDLFLRQPGHVFDPGLDCYSDAHKSTVICCNGIVCVHGIRSLCMDGEFNEHICLWNPALRVVKYIQIPDSGRINYLARVLVGFEFDTSSNDYKVIRYQEHVYDKEKKKVEIYSLSSDTWRTVKGATRNITYFFTNFYCHARASAVYVNETHHWAVINPTCELGRANYTIIVSFNMRDEVLKTISVPNELCEKRDLNIVLFNYHESLAALTFGESYYGNTNHEIWVMKDEYGMSESWTKVCKIDLPQMVYFRGFDEIKSELIFARSCEPGQSQGCSIVFDADKLEMKDESLTSNIEVLDNAAEVTTLRESLWLLNSSDLSTSKVTKNALQILVTNMDDNQ